MYNLTGDKSRNFTTKFNSLSREVDSEAVRYRRRRGARFSYRFVSRGENYKRRVDAVFSMAY